MAEIHIVTTCISNGKARSCHMRLALDQVGQYFGYALHGFDNERDAEVVGKRLRQIVLGAGRAIGAVNESGRAVTSDDTKCADLENLVE